MLQFRGDRDDLPGHEPPDGLDDLPPDVVVVGHPRAL